MKSICRDRGAPFEEFRPQIDRLEQALTGYVQGNATYDEVVSARIRYAPKQNGSLVKDEIPLVRKVRLTPEEHAALPRNRHTDGKQGHVDVQPVYEPKNEGKNPLPITISFSPKLQNLYGSNSRIDGYLVSIVMDATRQKIENDLNQPVIRENGSTRTMLQRIRIKHKLPSDANIYKMSPMGRFRTLYTRQGAEIKVLEIVPHPEYDRMLHAR